jgi:hypothetical protein
VPRLVGGIPVNGVCQGTVEDVHGHRDRLTPEVSRQLLGLDHAVCHANKALVLPLHYPILLKRIRGGELPLDAMLNTMLIELHRCELPPSPPPPRTIGAEDLQLLPCLNLDSGLELIDRRWRLILAR